MPKSVSLCNSFLALIYNATGIADIADNDATAPLTSISVRLHVASLTPSGTQSTSEATYTNYTGQVVPRTVAGWTAPVGGAISNVASIEFPQCGVTGNTIVAASTGKAASGASTIFHYGDLNAPIAVSNQIQPRFPSGAITITES